VLDLDVAEALELLLVTVGDEAEGVEEAERGLRAELRLEGVDDRRGAGRRRLGDGREGRGGVAA